MSASVLLVLACLAGGVFSSELYNVNQLIDESLEAVSRAVIAAGDITGRLEKLEVAGWALTGVRLADLSTLKRDGNCWMWSEDQTISVNGTLKLGAMFLVADSARGRGRSISQPLIPVQQNVINFLLQVTVDTKASCQANYSVAWKELRGVTLYPGDGGREVRLDQLVKGHQVEISAQLSPVLVRLLEDHSNMCESHRLNRLEMIRYNIDVQTMDQYMDFLKESPVIRLLGKAPSKPVATHLGRSYRE